MDNEYGGAARSQMGFQLGSVGSWKNRFLFCSNFAKKKTIVALQSWTGQFIETIEIEGNARRGK